MSYNLVVHSVWWKMFNERVAFPLKCTKNLTSVLKSVRPNSLYPGDVVRQAQHFYVTKDQRGVECIRLTELLARLHPHTHTQTCSQPASHPSIHLSMHPFIYSVSLTPAKPRQRTALCSTFPWKDLTSIQDLSICRFDDNLRCTCSFYWSIALIFWPFCQ